VYINTKSLKDRDEAERINAKCEEMLARGEAVADEVYAGVRGKFLG